MQRSTQRIVTTHAGRLPNPDNIAAIQHARTTGDQATFDQLVKAGGAAEASGVTAGRSGLYRGVRRLWLGDVEGLRPVRHIRRRVPRRRVGFLRAAFAKVHECS